jgi:hypothetical protein
MKDDSPIQEEKEYTPEETLEFKNCNDGVFKKLQRVVSHLS